MKILLQNDINSIEIRSVAQYCLVSDIPFYRCSIKELDDWIIPQLCLPVGSVEFVQKYCKLNDIKLPYFNQYPDNLKKFYGRQIDAFDIGEMRWIEPPKFIKPAKIKQFNGFVYRGFQGNYDSHDKEQLDILSKMDLGEELYVSPIVNFIAEWRVYVLNGSILAVARYDANDEEFDIDYHPFINEIVNIIGKQTLVVDIGLTDDEELLIVELNDAWAIGKYNGISARDYTLFLIDRWDKIQEFNSEQL